MFNLFVPILVGTFKVPHSLYPMEAHMGCRYRCLPPEIISVLIGERKGGGDLYRVYPMQRQELQILQGF